MCTQCDFRGRAPIGRRTPPRQELEGRSGLVLDNHTADKGRRAANWFGAIHLLLLFMYMWTQDNDLPSFEARPPSPVGAPEWRGNLAPSLCSGAW